jgi:hypothetical protein
MDLILLCCIRWQSRSQSTAFYCISQKEALMLWIFLQYVSSIWTYYNFLLVIIIIINLFFLSKERSYIWKEGCILASNWNYRPTEICSLYNSYWLQWGSTLAKWYGVVLEIVGFGAHLMWCVMVLLRFD